MSGDERDEELVRRIRSRTRRYPLGAGEAEELAVDAGIKPVFRQTLSEDDVERARARCAAKGLATEVVTAIAPRLRLTHRQAGWDAAKALHALYAGPDPERVREAARCEHRFMVVRPVVKHGVALGYPECCARAFATWPRPVDRQRILLAELSETRGSVDGLLDELDPHVFHFISWVPCKYDCAPSVALARRVAELVRARDPKFADEMETALRAPRIFVSDDVQLSLSGEIDGDEMRIGAVWPTAADRHPRSPPLSPASEASLLSWLRRLRVGGRLQVDARKVYIDGRRFTDLEPAVLVPFS